MTLQLYPKKTSSTFPYAVIGTLIGATVFVVWFFQIEPIYSLISAPINSFIVFISSINFNNLLPNVQQNWWQYIIGSLSAISVVSAIASKINSVRAEQAKQQAQLQTIEYQQEYVNMTQKLAETETKLKTTETQLANLQDTNVLTTAQTKISKLEKEKELLEARLKEAQTMVNVMHAPSEVDLIRTLENKGYAITKKVK